MKQTKITPIILAAGDSARMGFPKALLPIGGDTFLTRILRTLEHLGLEDPTVVLGKHAARIRPYITQWRVRIVVNPRPDAGQLSSIKLALSELDSCEACMLWPVDQPGITESLVRDLIRLFRVSGAPLALPCLGGKNGHPAIFRGTLFREILDTPVHEGLKQMVLRHRGETALLATEEVAVIEDVDTPADYFRLTGERLTEVLARSNEKSPAE
jgi:molybdenum cofactor cytidylyltransferase